MWNYREERITETRPVERVTPVSHEIERRWIVPKGKSLKSNTKDPVEIRQVYLFSGEDLVIRARNYFNSRLPKEKQNEYVLTLKSKGGLLREEDERPISLSMFLRMWNEPEGHRISKTRSFIPFDGDKKLSVDHYHGILKGLIKIEQEFPSIIDAEKAIVPNWILYRYTDAPKLIEATEMTLFSDDSLSRLENTSTLDGFFEYQSGMV